MTRDSLDDRVMQLVVDHRTPLLDDLALLLMHVGQSDLTALALILVTLAVTVRTRRWTWGAGVCVAAAGALVVAGIGKALVGRPRPAVADALVVAHGTAMPSSVAVLSAAMAVAAVLGWTDPRPGGRRRGALAVAIVAAIFGWAVIYLGAHWLTDVLVGWVLGAAVGVAAVPVGRAIAEGLQRRIPGAFTWLERYARDAAPAGSDAVVHAEEP